MGKVGLILKKKEFQLFQSVMAKVGLLSPTVGLYPGAAGVTRVTPITLATFTLIFMFWA